MASLDRFHSLLRLACKSGNGFIPERQNALEKAVAHARKYSIDLLRAIRELGIDLDGLSHSIELQFTRQYSTTSTTPPKQSRHDQDSSNRNYWSARPGEVSCKVPYVMNPRWTSMRRRYRDTEVTHGFPIKGLKEFFFFSTSIVSAGYDPSTDTLFLKFSDRELYRYSCVPESVVKSLIEATSHGSFARRYVCYSFQYERVNWSTFT